MKMKRSMANRSTKTNKIIVPSNDKHEIRQGQSVELLKELHILTRDGKLNQDSRRKLKQVYHLYQFIEPLLQELQNTQPAISLVDHGSGKSYLGFILYDLFFKNLENIDRSHIYGIETRDELVNKSTELANRLGFRQMSFLNLSVAESIDSNLIPKQVDIVTALHACNTASDDAIQFALTKSAKYIVLVPCCQAEVANILKTNYSKHYSKKVKSSKGSNNSNGNNDSKGNTDANCVALAELWRHAIHAREFGSHITNVLRCLQLEAHGYKVTATELVGWEHSLKNELILAKKINNYNEVAQQKLTQLLHVLNLEELSFRFNRPIFP